MVYFRDELHSILKFINPNLTLSHTSRVILEQIIKKIGQKLLFEGEKYENFDETIENFIGGELAAHTIDEYHRFLDGNYKLIYTKNTIAAVFPSTYSSKYFIEDLIKFISIVLECITIEILSLSEIVTTQKNLFEISPYFIYHGIIKNKELKNLIEKVFDMTLNEIMNWLTNF